MPIQTRGAVAFGPNQPMRIEQLSLEGPGPKQVLVELKATGLCHSDLHVLDGKTQAGRFPMVLGHEGAGIVLEVGREVENVRPGDHVIPYLVPECGLCPNCTSGKTNLCVEMFAAYMNPPAPKLALGGEAITTGWQIGSFAEHTVVDAIQVAKIRAEAPLDVVCYLACGGATGLGAALFAAKVERGSSVAVFGLGGIGLNVVQGAKLAGAGMIIGVDTNPEKEALARRLGLTHFVNPKEAGVDAVGRIRELTYGGADFTFEAVGSIALMQQAIEAARIGWGVCTIVGVAPDGTTIPVGPNDLLSGRRIQGTTLGGVKGRTDLPVLVERYLTGEIELDSLISHRIKLDEINHGFDMMKTGEATRSVVIY